MAERTYRRITEDIEEVRFIARLVDAIVTIQAPVLSGASKVDEDKVNVFIGELSASYGGAEQNLTNLRRLLEYRDKWNGILADLTAESQPSAKTSTSTPRGTRATGKPRTGGDADKSE